eukprot:TRINITY_DN20076_c0_g1_i1.p1 TRINITY_DN20076_c0_g1~~TRINITY_DN20076_c0_g1_i1.p1  ORF type:complete len:382 (-),score=106.68 TRINITY_DN20076_c0_g1_i1:170-1315(-)
MFNPWWNDDDINEDEFLYNENPFYDDFGAFGGRKKQKSKNPPKPPTVKKLKNLLEPCKPENGTRGRRAAIRKYLKSCEFWLDHTEKVVKYTDRNHENQPYYTTQYAQRTEEEDNKSDEQIRCELRRLRNPVPTVEDLTALSEGVDMKVSDRAKKLLRHWGYRDNGRWGTDPPIVRYARSGMLRMVKLLVEEGFKVDECLQWTETGGTFNHKSWDWDGDNALMAAAREGHEDVVRYLLEKGANRGHRCCPTDDVYVYPAEAARNKGHEKIAKLIEGVKEEVEKSEVDCKIEVEVKVEDGGQEDEDEEDIKQEELDEDEEQDIKQEELDEEEEEDIKQEELDENNNQNIQGGNCKQNLDEQKVEIKNEDGQLDEESNKRKRES